jgi:UPF0176 protein
MPNIEIAALYHFSPLPNFVALKEPLKAALVDHDVKGSLLIAPEGINGTIAGSSENLAISLDKIKALTGFHTLEHKTAFTDIPPFFRAKVRLKKEIVKMGVPTVNPLNIVGTYVEPKDWNALISDPDVVVIDTRNDYEFRIGTFKHALDPKTKVFTEFPAYISENLDPAKHKKVAMFCTGGIRCEKASSYMKSQGFDEVYHLKGGILKYLETVPEEQSLWSGGCYVFDDRIAVGHGLLEQNFFQCKGCGEPHAPEEECPTCKGRVNG